MTVVQQAEVAFREFLGGNRVQLQPGLHIKLPVLHTLWRVDMRERGINIAEIVGFTKDNVPIKVSGTLFIQVDDPEKACFGVSDYFQAVTAIGQSAVRSIIGRFDYDTLTAERNQINVELRDVIGKTIAGWGTMCTRFEIQTMAPANQSVTEQLEAQMRAERARRENELNVRASINTAEGEKRAQILRSEGALQAARNEADAQKYAIQAQTEAVVEQIRFLKDSLPSASDAVIVDYLLESKRLENLKVVGEGSNKQIYFLDPRLEATSDVTKRAKIITDMINSSGA